MSSLGIGKPPVDYATILRTLVNDLLAACPDVGEARSDPEVAEAGRSFLVLAGPRSGMIERWVRELRLRSGVQIDWEFFGGRAVVYGVIRSREHVWKLMDWVELLWPALEYASVLAWAGGSDGDYPVERWTKDVLSSLRASDEGAEVKVGRGITRTSPERIG